MTPRRLAFAPGEPRYLPTLRGASQASRVRSPLIAVHDCPPFVVLQTTFDVK